MCSDYTNITALQDQKSWQRYRGKGRTITNPFELTIQRLYLVLAKSLCLVLLLALFSSNIKCHYFFRTCLRHDTCRVRKKYTYIRISERMSCKELAMLFRKSYKYGPYQTKSLKLSTYLKNVWIKLFQVCIRTRTTDAQRRNSLHCTAENLIPIPNFQVRPKHILSATSAQFFRYL